MNILFSSSGRRSYLINFFKEVAKEYGLKIFATNNKIAASSLYFADEYFKAPPILDSNYVTFLLNLCTKKKIKLLIPLYDLDVLVLSQHKIDFERIGTKLMVVDNEVAKFCNDKYELQLILSKNKFNSIPCLLNNERLKSKVKKSPFKFPLIIKPRNGMGSIGVFNVENENELDIFIKKCQQEIFKSEINSSFKNKVLIQNQIYGVEFGLDIINNLEGVFQTTIVKKKLEMRSGETDKAEVVENKGLFELGKKISKLIKHPGIIDVDVIVDESGNPFIIDINPRFGGGYPFTHIANVNLPLAIINWLMDPKKDMSKFLIPKIGTIGLKTIDIIKLPV